MAEKKKTTQFIPMTSTQAAIGGGVLIGCFALWFLWAAVGESILCWIESHSGMASWVQAVGAITAIGIAFFVARYQSKLAEKKSLAERRNRAKAYSVAINKVKEYFQKIKLVLNNYDEADWFFHSWESPKDRFNKEEFDFLVNIVFNMDVSLYDQTDTAKALIELKLSIIEMKKTVDYLASLDNNELKRLYEQEPNIDYDAYEESILNKLDESCDVLINY